MTEGTMNNFTNALTVLAEFYEAYGARTKDPKKLACLKLIVNIAGFSWRGSLQTSGLPQMMFDLSGGCVVELARELDIDPKDIETALTLVNDQMRPRRKA